MTADAAATIAVAGLSTAAMIIRPFRLPEAIWTCGGALVLVLTGLLPLSNALEGASQGADVYLFLAGMMLIAEAGRSEGLFDWLAQRAVRHAAGSPRRLFTAIFAIGTVVTIFLSNDATAVVLTPAVYAAARAADAEPLPYLLICAFVANAASFVLPISNPANLVVYGEAIPALAEWLVRFSLPAITAIVTTYVVLRVTQRGSLRGSIRAEARELTLSRGGRLAALGICLMALVLTTASLVDLQLGLSTFLAGLATVCGILLLTRTSPVPYVRNIAWGILPLVAGLFVLAEALNRIGLMAALDLGLTNLAGGSAAGLSWVGGVLAALATNLGNNLPVGLLAGAAIRAAHPSTHVASAILIGIDLGPNLSVAGSLATILWLAALRREGLRVSAWQFLRVGAIAMPLALILAIAAVLATG